jgi:hypothetical protein
MEHAPLFSVEEQRSGMDYSFVFQAADTAGLVRDLIAAFDVTHRRNVDGDDTDDPREISSLGFEAYGLSFICFPCETPVEITFFCTVDDEMINTGINQLHCAFLRQRAIGPIALFAGVGRDRPVHSDG